jgi:hypothetical protein
MNPSSSRSRSPLGLAYSAARTKSSSQVFMSMRNPKTTGYSADVRMHLSLNGHVLKIAQLGPNFLVLKNATDHPPVDAEIAMCIDGQEDRWRVHLPEGTKSEQRKTAISKVPHVNGSGV